jgi:hypothetical protein
MVRAALIAVALVLAAPGLAHADTDYFSGSGDASAVKIRRDKPRTTKQRILIYGLLGGAAVGLGVGLYFHWDSHVAADDVATSHVTSPSIWNEERQDTYDRAGTSGNVAIVAYSVSAACAIGAIVAAVLTHPGEEVSDLRPATSLSITHGGAMVARAWQF